MTAAAAFGPIAWMVVASVITGAALWLSLGSRAAPELAWGIAGPLASAAVSWWVIARTERTAPDRLTHVLIGSFGVKVLLFGLYLVVMLKGLALRPMPFMLSFTGYYVALHIAEAVFLRRLLAGRVSGGSGDNRVS
jgi:cobalamin synthase